jgi:hypothetical protein
MLCSKLVVAQLYEYREMIKQSMTKGSLFCKLAHENLDFRFEIKSFNNDLKRLLEATPRLDPQKLIDAFNALYDGNGNLIHELFTKIPKLHQFYDARLDFLCARNETFLKFVESESNRKESPSSSLMAITTAYDIERDRATHNHTPRNRADSSLLPNKYLAP